MLEPRTKWPCSTVGCCVFVGGTAYYDIYMGRCHEKPYEPHVILVPIDGTMYTEFTSVSDFERQMADPDSMILQEYPKKPDELGAALTFVQCFFPTPVRTAMDKMARGEEL
jgi:hypothetical protein